MKGRRSDPLARILYRISSGNRLSRTMGFVSEVAFPVPVLANLIRTYCAAFGVSLTDTEVPAGGFRTFNEFFTRRLKTGARPVDGDPKVISSPCDGRVMSTGVVSRGLALQAKGQSYPLARLLGDEALCARFEGGPYLTIYLSPRDYHRVHFPCDGEVERCIHLPGLLYTVAPRATELVDCLLCRNERLNTVLQTPFGTAAVVMVGATGVGRITVSYGAMTTNVGECSGRTSFDPPLTVAKGDELGVFNVGSTVVLVLEAGKWETRYPAVGESVQMGQPLLKRKD